MSPPACVTGAEGGREGCAGHGEEFGFGFKLIRHMLLARNGQTQLVWEHPRPDLGGPEKQLQNEHLD